MKWKCLVVRSINHASAGAEDNGELNETGQRGSRKDRTEARKKAESGGEIAGLRWVVLGWKDGHGMEGPLLQWVKKQGLGRSPSGKAGLAV